ncbi:hypothetical protein [Actinomadura luteofluorescens]
MKPPAITEEYAMEIVVPGIDAAHPGHANCDLPGGPHLMPDPYATLPAN